MMDKIFYENEYVLWLEFDEQTNEFLNEKCILLDQSNIATGIRPPHITITFVQCDNEERVVNTVIEFFKKINELSFMINSIGIFSGGVVFYEPKITIELLQLHKELSQALSKVASLSWDLYLPDRWTPHIALTGTLTGESLKTAITIMSENFMEFKTNRTIVKLKKCFTGEEVVNLTIGE